MRLRRSQEEKSSRSRTNSNDVAVGIASPRKRRLLCPSSECQSEKKCSLRLGRCIAGRCIASNASRPGTGGGIRAPPSRRCQRKPARPWRKTLAVDAPPRSSGRVMRPSLRTPRRSRSHCSPCLRTLPWNLRRLRRRPACARSLVGRAQPPGRAPPGYRGQPSRKPPKRSTIPVQSTG
jgi:hypothetical protein